MMNGVSDTEKDLLAGAKTRRGAAPCWEPANFVKIEGAPTRTPTCKAVGVIDPATIAAIARKARLHAV